MTFPKDYEYLLDPELAGSGAPVSSSKALGESARLLLVVPKGQTGWIAELGEGTLVCGGLTGVFPTPSPVSALAVVNGRGYLVRVETPGSISALRNEPITGITAVPDQQILLVVTPWQLIAYGFEGKLWETDRLAVDGLKIERIDGRRAVLAADIGDERPLEVFVDLDTGQRVEKRDRPTNAK